METFDYIVVGGGSAGCVAAARLAEEASVLLLEAGDAATAHPETLSSDGFKYAFSNDALMWHRMSARQKDCGGRSLYIGTGRGMGGSGSVNGMVYTRGDRRDFDAWPEGWRWADVVPVFEALEARLGIRPRPPTPFAETFMAAAGEAGFARKDGMNDGDLSGVVGANAMNYDGDQRRSSYRAFVHEGAASGLTVRTGARLYRLLFQGKRAIAVEYEREGRIERAAIGREVVMAAGALETPRLLMLSGVGPAEELARHGIALVQDAPGIGENLQDHPNVCMFYTARAPVDFHYPQVYGFDVAARRPDQPRGAAPDTCFVCYAAPASLKESMRRMVPVLALPGRLHGVAPLRALLRGLIELAFRLPPLKAFVASIFGIVVILGKPTSRGSLRLASADPRAPARIDLRYFATAQDRATMEAGIARARDIAARGPLRRAGAKPLSAGAKPVAGRRLWSWLTGAAMTTFHFCGTCRMGEDAASPVDSRLRLKGLANVRVADASVMPEIPVSALNAPSMMIGYRAADFILSGETA